MCFFLCFKECDLIRMVCLHTANSRLWVMTYFIKKAFELPLPGAQNGDIDMWGCVYEFFSGRFHFDECLREGSQSKRVAESLIIRERVLLSFLCTI